MLSRHCTEHGAGNPSASARVPTLSDSRHPLVNSARRYAAIRSSVLHPWDRIPSQDTGTHIAQSRKRYRLDLA